MTHKLSDKFKIVLAVIAVVTVAAGAAAAVALSSNDNDVQAQLSAGQSINFKIYSIVGTDEVNWATSIDAVQPIPFESGNSVITYFSGSSVDHAKIILSQIKSDGTLIGESKTYSTFDEMEISASGLYKAEVTAYYDSGETSSAQATFYAQIGEGEQIGKTKLSAGLSLQGLLLQYTGAPIEDLFINVSNNAIDGGIVFVDVSFTDAENDTSTRGITIQSGGLFDVTYAGDYTVTLKIADAHKDNYEFADGSDSKTFTFTVDQKVIESFSFTLKSDSEYRTVVNYIDNMTVEDLLAKFSFVDNNAICDAEIGIFDGSTQVTSLTNDCIGKTYSAKVLKLLPKNAGDKGYLNYRLPQSGEDGYGNLSISFPMQAPPLPTPSVTATYYENPDNITFPNDNTFVSASGSRISAPYLNFGYKISQWFCQGNDNLWELPLDQKGHNYGRHWVVTVNGATVDPNEYTMTDVGTYNVNIKPEDGYHFDDAAEYDFTLTIAPFTLGAANVVWDWEGKDKHIYDGNPVVFGEGDYRLELPNMLMDDVTSGKISLTFERIKVSEYENIDGDPVDAGRYYYKVKGFEGDKASDYTLPENGISNNNPNDASMDHPFIIYRKKLPNFSAMDPVITGTFNGSQQTKIIENELILLGLGFLNDENAFVPCFQQNLDVAGALQVERSYPAEWNLGSAVFRDDDAVGYDSVTEEHKYSFKFTHAGSYTLKIIATTALKNYCWYGENNSPLYNTAYDPTVYTWENFALIDRVEINPLFTPTNISTKDEDIKIAEQIAAKFQGLKDGDNPVYTLIFGDGTTTDILPLDKNPDGSYKEGDYYILVNVGEFYPSVYFKAPASGEDYTVNGSQARVNYTVKSGVVDISAVVRGYTFGDNFASGFGVSDVVTVTKNDVDGVAYGETEVKFYTDAGCTQSAILLDGAGVPRNAGKYYVSVTVHYTVAGDATDYVWSRSYELNVAKRQVALEWQLDGAAASQSSASFTYDSTKHTVAVVNTNTVAGVTNVTFTLDNASVTEAGTYNYAVTAINGAEADNYTLDGVTNNSFSVVINRASVTVTADSVSNVTFNEGGLTQELTFKVTSGSFYGSEEDSFKVAVYNASGVLVKADKYSTIDIGTYTFVPVWEAAGNVMPQLVNGAYQIEQGNYVITVQTTTFKVVAQKLTITFKTGINSDYGVDMDLWATIQSVMAGSSSMTVEQLKEIANITASKDGVTVTASKDGLTVSPEGAQLSAGEYTLGVVLVGGEFDLEITNPTVTYTVNYRKIYVSPDSGDVPTYRYGDMNTAPYLKFNIVDKDGNPVEDDTVSSKIEICWFEKGSKWVRVSSIAEKAVGGSYYRAPYFKDGSVSLTRDVKFDSDVNKYYYEKAVGNYNLTVYLEEFVINHRLLTLTFIDGSSIYGDSIDLWTQKQTWPWNTDYSNAYKNYAYFDYVQAEGLRFVLATHTDKSTTDQLQDVIEFTLYANGTSYDPSDSAAKINAVTYGYKAKLINGNYKLVSGGEEVDELVGGQFVVSPKNITVTINATAASIVYGNGLASAGTVVIPNGALIDGDDLGAVVSIYNSANTAIALGELSQQSVGTGYYVGLTYTNANYNVSCANVPFEIKLRNVTVTPNPVSNVYGTPFDVSAITWNETLSDGSSGEAVVNGDSLDISARVNGLTDGAGIAALNVKEGGYAITLVKGTNASSNYNVTLSNGVFTVTQRKVVLKPDGVNHDYGTAYDASAPKYSIAEGSFVSAADETAMHIVAEIFNGASQNVTADITNQPAGSYTIKLKVTDTNPNYNVDVTTHTADFEIVVRKAIVQFKSDVSYVYGTPVLLAYLRDNIVDNNLFTIDGLLEGDKDNVAVTVTKLDDSDVSAIGNEYAPVGDYVIVVTLGGNYQVEYVNWKYESNKGGAYKITERSVTIKAADVANHVYGKALAENELHYTVTNGSVLANDRLNVTLNVVNGANPVANENISKLDAKSYSVSITDNGTANYSVTVDNTGTFTVVPREITVTFVEAQQGTGTASICHSTYYKDSPSVVDNTLYSDKVITLGANDLVNGATLRQVLSLKAVNANGVNATTEHAPAGDYTITPTVIDGNYKLANASVTGVYVIGEAKLQMTGFMQGGTFPYTGAPQKLGDAAYVASDGSDVTIKYVLVPNSTVLVDESQLDWSKATTTMPTVTEVSNNMVYMRATADNYEKVFFGVSLNVTPVTLTITANDVTLTYYDELTGITNGGKLPASAYTYKQTADVPQGVDEYAGLIESVRNLYLGRLTCETNYTRGTAANAAEIVITPKYDFAKDDNVTVVLKSGTVTINKAALTDVTVTSGHASGVYTGEAFKLFDIMRATTVDGTNVVWYYRADDTDEWTVYNDQTATNVCNVSYEVKAVDPNGNHNDVVLDGSNAIGFVISQNSIVVQLQDNSITYGDELSTVTFTAAVADANGLVDAVKDNYINTALSASYLNVAGYTVTANADSKWDITSSYAGDDNGNVKVTVNKGTLTVSQRAITVSFVNDKSNYYGDAAVAKENLYSISVGKLVNNDELTINVLDEHDVSAYADKAHAGTYRVEITASANYEVSYANGDADDHGTYIINKRVLTPSLEQTQVTYTEQTDEDSNPVYNNGIYGAEHNAAVNFGNLVIGEQLSVNSGYTVTYSTVDIGDWQIAGKAPRCVGKYDVTVVLNNGNYTFTDSEGNETNSATIGTKFEVIEKEIDASKLEWKYSTIKYVDSATKTPNFIENYIADLMKLVDPDSSFVKKTASGSESYIKLGDASTNNTYYFENGMLYVAALGRAEYSVTFTLNSDAGRNYKFANLADGVENVTLTFYVVSEEVKLTVNSAGWQYTDIPTEDSINALINFAKPMYGLSYEYARLESEKGKELLSAKKNTADYGGFDSHDEILAGAFTSLTKLVLDSDSEDYVLDEYTFDVGYYIICVTYNTFSKPDGVEAGVGVYHAVKYDVIEVAKKQLSIATTINDSPYNGKGQWQNVECKMDGQDISNLLNVAGNNMGSALFGENVGEYEATVTIKDTDHYVWTDSMNADSNGVVTVTWRIVADTTGNEGNRYFEVGSISQVTYGSDVVRPELSLKNGIGAGYGNAFTWYYASKDEFASAADENIVWTLWTDRKPTQAGSYFAKVVLSDTHEIKNFDDKIAYGEFDIGKAELILTPSGTMVYGNVPAQTNGSYTVSGLIGEDTQAVVKNVDDRTTIYYALVLDSGVDREKLSVGTYKITVRLDGDYVYGLTADNYYIKPASDYGVFTVTPLEIEVTIGGASGQYGLKPDLTSVKVTYNGTVDNKLIIEGVKNALTTDADETSVVRDENYTIQSGYSNGNFDIKYTNGVYKVTAREIKVTLNADNAGGTYKGAIGEVEIATVKDVNGNDVSELVGSNYLTVVYGGTANDGTAYDGQNTHAGKFTATVEGNAANKNFKIVDAQTVEFTVLKIVVDSKLITTDSQMYTGSELTPNINDDYYNVNGVRIYNVIYNAHELVNAGDHYLTLELIDGNNYAWTAQSNTVITAEIKFVIASAGIYAIPSGKVVYGATENEVMLSLKCDYVYASGINAGQSANSIVKGTPTFEFVDKSLDLGRLSADKYAITLKTVNGFVEGVTSEDANYANIALKLTENDEVEYGVFEVVKRAITVTVNDSQSVYSQAIDLTANGFKITEGSLVFEDVERDIAFSITADTSSWKNVGNNYVITAQASLANYDVTVINGTHVITQLEVSVTVRAADGIYIDKAVAVTTEQTGNVSYDFGADFINKYTFKYIGTDYESETLPTAAGTYTATVTAINDGNFKLAAVTDATFTIAKKVVDQDGIAVKQDAVYNGREQSHGIQAVAGVYTVTNGTYKNADTYDVVLTLADGNNYSWKGTNDVEIVKKFVIAKAPLTLKPHGVITYGESFQAHVNEYGFELIGLLGGDEGKNNGEIVTGSVVYMLANGADGTRLAVKDGGYEMTANIDGLQCENYNVTVLSGVFTVNRREITIKPKASSSVYYEDVVLSDDFDFVSGSLADWDSKSVIDYRASSEASKTSNADVYDVLATAFNPNYDITVQHGSHTISKAKVGVRIRAINGTYGDVNNGAHIEFMSTDVIHSDGSTEAINTLRFVIRYVGTAHDLTYYDGSVIPVKAGVYTASVTDVLNNNYVLDEQYGIRETVMEIFKREIDASQIKAVSASYTGDPIIPVIEDTLYNVNGLTVYEPVFGAAMIKVGKYDVTLRLLDVYNYEWRNNLNSTDTIKFEIIKADNRLVDSDNPDAPEQSVKIIISDWTFGGEANEPQANVASGSSDIVFEYATSENGDYTREVPKNAGEYWVRATVAASENYNAYVSASTKFVIGKKIVALPTVTNLNENSVYTGSMLSLVIEGFDDQIMSLTLDKGMYRSDVDGKLNLLALNADTYTATFRLRNSGNYAWANAEDIVDETVVVNWTVERKVIDRLPDASNKILVNGEDIVFIPEGFNSGIMTIESNVHAHEGHYTAVITLKDTNNYAWAGTESPSITVEFELTGTNTAFIASICVVAGLCVGLAVMAIILTLVNRRKKRKQEEAIEKRSRADGWEEE